MDDVDAKTPDGADHDIALALRDLQTALKAAAEGRKRRQERRQEPLGGDRGDAPAPREAPGLMERKIELLEQRLEKARAGIVRRDERIAALERAGAQQAATIEEIHASRSWRITAPIRRLRSGA